MRDDAVLHPDAGTNLVGRHEVPDGGSVPDLDRWPIQVDGTVESPRLAPVNVEPLNIFAEELDGVLHVRCGPPAPHRLQKQFAQLLGLAGDLMEVDVADL